MSQFLLFKRLMLHPHPTLPAGTSPYLHHFDLKIGVWRYQSPSWLCWDGTCLVKSLDIMNCQFMRYGRPGLRCNNKKSMTFGIHAYILNLLSLSLESFQSPVNEQSCSDVCVDSGTSCHVQASGTWYFAMELIRSPSFANCHPVVAWYRWMMWWTAQINTQRNKGSAPI